MTPDDELYDIECSSKKPKIDGHFWIKRNNQVIDPNFPNFNKLVHKTWNCEGPKIYLEAPINVQSSMINLFKEADKSDRFKTWEAFVERFCNLTYICDGLGVRMPNCCWINTVLEYHENGGEIIFGSMGWKIKDSNKTHYEFGSAKYIRIEDFICK